jgi:hypothetical protein
MTDGWSIHLYHIIGKIIAGATLVGPQCLFPRQRLVPDRFARGLGWIIMGLRGLRTHIVEEGGLEERALCDPDIYPSEEFLSGHLGRASAAFAAMVEGDRAEYPAMEKLWKYYGDVKSWLYKASRKKKTVFWLSIGEGYSRATFLFDPPGRGGPPGFEPSRGPRGLRKTPGDQDGFELRKSGGLPRSSSGQETTPCRPFLGSFVIPRGTRRDRYRAAPGEYRRDRGMRPGPCAGTAFVADSRHTRSLGRR